MEILSVCRSVCPYVITSTFPRITPESCHTPHVMHHRKEYDISDDNDNDTHRDKDKDNDKGENADKTHNMLYFQKAGSSRISDMTLTKTMTKIKTKTKVLKRLNICYIFEKAGGTKISNMISLPHNLLSPSPYLSTSYSSPPSFFLSYAQNVVLTSGKKDQVARIGGWGVAKSVNARK